MKPFNNFDSIEKLVSDMGLNSAIDAYSVKKWGKKGDWDSWIDYSNISTNPSNIGSGTYVNPGPTTAVSSSIDNLNESNIQVNLTTERLSEMIISLEAKLDSLSERVDKLYKILQADRDAELLKEEKKDDSVFLEFFDGLDDRDY